MKGKPFVTTVIAAPGHVYGLLATLGKLRAAFGIRWLGYIYSGSELFSSHSE